MLNKLLKGRKLRVKPSTNKIYKVIYLSLGLGFTFLGILGFILPILPGFLFLIPGIYFLAKSSTRLHNWMKKHKHIGKYFHHE